MAVENKPKPKPRIVPDVLISGPRLDMDALRTMARNEPAAFAAKVQGLIDGGMRWSDVRDLRHLYRSLRDVQIEVLVNDAGDQRAVMASAFPLLSGGLTVAGLNDAYDAIPTIGQELVSELEDPKVSTTLAAVHTLDVGKDRVNESEDFPEIGASEEKYTIGQKRNGRRLSITMEAIEENDVPGISEKVNALGEIASDFVEEQTLSRVCDLHGSASSPAEPYVMHRNGAAASLYSSTANTPSARTPSGTRVTNNALADVTNLDAARTVLAAMKNERGKRIAIPISRCKLLVPDALAGTAGQILRSEMVSGVVNEVSAWGPRGDYRPRLLSSPKMDDLSTSAWYLGWFEKQFVRKWKLRMEYMTLTGDTESKLRSRIAAQFRVAWNCEIGARDHVYVVQCLSGTTAPTATNVP